MTRRLRRFIATLRLIRSADLWESVERNHCSIHLVVTPAKKALRRGFSTSVKCSAGVEDNLMQTRLLPLTVAARKIVLHVNSVPRQKNKMKTNVTLKLDADLLREARVVAAEEGRSISALLTDRLEAMVRERKAFDKARRRAVARLREGLDLQWTPPKSRDELHER
jgi:hypothetical protein